MAYNLKLAKLNYQKLQCEVEIANIEKIDMEQLCEKLGGHNYDGKLFDVNYGNICATITKDKHKMNLYNNVEIWDDEYLSYFDYDMK